jgi:hypothetical protein
MERRPVAAPLVLTLAAKERRTGTDRQEDNRCRVISVLLVSMDSGSILTALGRPKFGYLYDAMDEPTNRRGAGRLYYLPVVTL